MKYKPSLYLKKKLHKTDMFGINIILLFEKVVLFHLTPIRSIRYS